MDLIVSKREGQWRAGPPEDPARWRCAIGRGGVSGNKREGDGATPVGRWPLRRVLFRPDRLERPRTVLDAEPIAPEDGWCDDPAHSDYNRPVRLPFAAGHERLWREDGIYDLIAVLGHNDDPPTPEAGSAIFLHVARPNYAPTEGCVALALPALLDYLALATSGDAVVVHAAD
jgi:L,D-peptidoglycan transpeptidase YkuD (ErfK/YbiS/YcfS/YnhG family)